VAVSPDGRRAYTASADKLILVWDVETGEEVRRLEGHSAPVRRMAFTPDGTRLLSASNDADGTLALWDLASGEMLRKFLGHRYSMGVAISPDGRWALSGGQEDLSARLWNLATGEEVARLLGHEDAVREVAFTPDGQRAITNALDGTVRIWDLSEVIETESDG
jgi:WD40 repeat protein